MSEVSTKALLRIHIADVDGVVAKNRTVIIKRVNNNFDEDSVTWSNYDVREESESWIEFNIHNDDVGKVGQVDVSSLMIPGENINLAIHTRDNRHVKFASREHDNPIYHPKLLILEVNEI